eukprot:12573472-Alexandrium_andersonii.AAC.1
MALNGAEVVGGVDLKQLRADGAKARQATRSQFTCRAAIILIESKDKAGTPKFYAEAKKLQIT